MKVSANRVLPELEEAEPAEGPSLELIAEKLAKCLDGCAILLDIDGTLLDLCADTARGVGAAGARRHAACPARADERRALALVSGRSLNDIDLIFAPDRFPGVGGHGAELRLSTDSEAVATHAPPMDKELKSLSRGHRKRLSPGILLEDKGYSLALH